MARRRGRKKNGADRRASEAVAEAEEAELQKESEQKSRWAFHEGDEIAPGRFVLKRLGGGSAYEAHIAWDEELHSTVVVKVLRPDHALKRKSLDHLRREVQILTKLNHPIIVRCFGAVTSGERPHIVLEHLEGPRLSTLIRKYGPLPLEQLLPLGLRICAALHYIHTKRIVHLDVKPANIVMSSDPRLIDFSIARTWKQAEQLPSDVGTRRFMAPEQCLPGERGVIGARTDIYGLGATLYRAISGEYAFEFAAPSTERDPILRFPQLTQEPIPLPDEIPVQVREPVMATLDPDPGKRPTAAELSAQLEPLVAMLPTARPLGRKRPRLG